MRMETVYFTLHVSGIKLLLEGKCSTNIPNMKGETAQNIPLNEDENYLLHMHVSGVMWVVSGTSSLMKDVIPMLGQQLNNYVILPILDCIV